MTKTRKSKLLFLLLFGVMMVVLIAMVALEGCAPQSLEESDSNNSETTSEKEEWSTESSCITCHDKQTSDSTGSALYSVHLDQGVTCLSCHTDTDTLKTLHDKAGAGKAAPKKLTTTSITQETCLSCHDTTLEELAEKTAGATTLTDKNGTTVNPHALPEVKDHSKITCTSCHGVHEEGEPLEQCLTCHHADVFECNTCHD